MRADVGVSLSPGLAASVLFLCVRQADSRGDQSVAVSLCRAAVAAMKTALKVTAADVWSTDRQTDRLDKTLGTPDPIHPPPLVSRLYSFGLRVS